MPILLACIARGNDSFFGRVEISWCRILPSGLSHIYDPSADNRLQPDHFPTAIDRVTLRNILAGIGSRAGVAGWQCLGIVELLARSSGSVQRDPVAHDPDFAGSYLRLSTGAPALGADIARCFDGTERHCQQRDSHHGSWYDGSPLRPCRCRGILARILWLGNFSGCSPAAFYFPLDPAAHWESAERSSSCLRSEERSDGGSQPAFCSVRLYCCKQ